MKTYRAQVNDGLYHPVDNKSIVRSMDAVLRYQFHEVKMSGQLNSR